MAKTQYLISKANDNKIMTRSDKIKTTKNYLSSERKQ